jgi:hypothetical protein
VTYLITAAGGLFTSGVAAPLMAAVFDLGTGNLLSALILVLGIVIFLLASGARHLAGSHGFEVSQAMTDIQVGAFIVASMMAVAFEWGVTLWARWAA